MKKLINIIVLIGFAQANAFAQFPTGISTSNYSGVMGISINPANTNYLNNGTDFMLFGFSGNAMNNGLYMNAKPVTKIISPEIIDAFSNKENNNGESVSQTFDRVFDMKRDLKDNNYIFADATIYGPSFLINLRKHSFGILSSFKTASSTVKLAPEMLTFLLKGSTASDLQYKTFKLNNVVSGTLVYTDIAFNYSYQIFENDRTKQRLGASVHYLKGINSINFEDLGNTTWSFIGDSSIYMTKGDFSYNYAATKSAEIKDLLERRGSGFSFDLGYTYMKKKKSRPTRLTVCPNIRFLGRIRTYQEYKWRLGVAIMDIGYIKFNNQTVTNNYKNAYGETKNLDLSFYNGVFALERQLRESLSGNPGTILTNEKEYTVFTPMRFNFQFDYYFRENLFFNFSGTQRIPMPGTLAMRAPNILSLTTRYEKQNYEIGVPISLIEYQYPVLGFNFRVGPFYMGTNHLLEMVGIRKIKGLDLFLGLKFNLSNFRGV
ncbi:MAG: DUF5723 family protein [Bacteroidia bacterium]|nr:DUF5723 family protein [Bacteroidia bacterium]MCF8426271.1 DUF5723 family protein [Bacteroidia bacterium]MCF8445476.1 DUF5723 family protein [Bacteroidia bacterium]